MTRNLSLKEQEIFESLRAVVDPELMVNIVDLGLVYDVRLNEETKVLQIDLTLTSPGCPMGDVMAEDIKQFLLSEYSEFTTEIQLVWEPAWTPDRITEKGRELLGKS